MCSPSCSSCAHAQRRPARPRWRNSGLQHGNSNTQLQLQQQQQRHGTHSPPLQPPLLKWLCVLPWRLILLLPPLLPPLLPLPLLLPARLLPLLPLLSFPGRLPRRLLLLVFLLFLVPPLRGPRLPLQRPQLLRLAPSAVHCLPALPHLLRALNADSSAAVAHRRSYTALLPAITLPSVPLAPSRCGRRRLWLQPTRSLHSTKVRMRCFLLPPPPLLLPLLLRPLLLLSLLPLSPLLLLLLPLLLLHSPALLHSLALGLPR